VGSDGESGLADGEAMVCFDFAALREVAHDPDAYGRLLTGMLFADPTIALAWTKVRSASATLRVRLALRATDTKLQALCWETLRDPEALDGMPLVANQNLLFSRFTLSALTSALDLPARRALRVAAVIANPSDLPRYGFQPLDTAAEIDRLREVLAAFQPRILTRGSPHGSPTLPILLQTLRDGTEILVIIAHGSIHAGKSVLWLEQDDGTARRVTGAELTTQISALTGHPLLVFLAACRSAGDDTASEGLSGLGPLLGQVGVPAVVAMQGNISMATMARLLPSFLRELGVWVVLEQRTR